MSIKTNALIIRDETADGANTALRVGQLLSDIADDLIAKQVAIDLNNAKVSNVDHPLVETAVPLNSVFTDTTYDDTALQAAVALNTLKESNIAHPLVEKAVPSNAVFTDTIYDDSDVLKDSDTVSPVTSGNKLMTESDVAGLGGGDMLSSIYDPIIASNTAKVGITPQQASDITANNDKISYTDAAAVAANTAKETNIVHPLVETAVPVGAVFTDTIYDDTAIQAEVALNTLKVGVTAQMVSDIDTNNLKVGITTQQADDIVANNAKVTYPSADSTKLGLIEAEATKDTTATIQTKRPLKTVNGESLEGSGDIVVAGGGQPDSVVEDLAVTGTKTINWNSGETYRFTLTGAVVLSDSNLVSVGKSEIITLYVDGDFALTLPTGWDAYKTGTYDGTVLNTITVEYVNAATPFHKVTIIQ